MMALFQPDIFSGAHPIFAASPGPLAAAVRETAARIFPAALSSVTDVQQFVGNEINSNNFRLESGTGVYLLKRLPAKADAQALRRQLRLTAWLRESAGVAVPRIHAAATGELLSDDGESRWCLFEFLPGDFFAGGAGQLRSVALAIGALQSALRRCPTELAPPAKWQYLTADDAAVFDGVVEARARWDELFGATAAAQLAACWDQVRAVHAELEDRRAFVFAQRPSACHSDMHPHNLLLAGDVFAAFIDFESLTSMPETAALGFAVYKLLRQHAVSQRLGRDDGARIAADCAAFLDTMRATVTDGGDVASLRLMAIAEIFRRLLIVFRLNLRDRNGAWNHVMPMHLAAFPEIDIIFGSGTNAA